MSRNKELLNEYKQRKFRMGVFALRNTLNGKLFIGSGLNLDALWNRVRAELRLNGHRNEALQSDWNALGESAFEYEVLSEITEEPGSVTDYGYEVKKLEKMFLEEMQPWGEKGYHNVPRN
ncbi:MAG: GIY-YIG nuclease family protein [Chitinophagaceae bacterium]|nr:MAG: GIY-YIG nuclease family protein [Chitinophagaceae bacterium]